MDPDKSPSFFSKDDFNKALFNILEDANTEKELLRENQSAIINILDDFTHEKTRLQDSQRAVLNILDDFTQEKERLKDMQRAVINILDDFRSERMRLQGSQRALVNILEDVSVDKGSLQDTQRAVLNILDDFATERDRLQDTQRAIINILDDLHVEKAQLIVTQRSLTTLTKDLEIRVSARTEDLVQANKHLHDSAQKVLKASQYKSEFLANMSHELRTPLNSILLLADLLASNHQGNLDEKQVKSAKTIRDSGSDLLTLINEIMDLSKVEAGKMDIHIQPFDLHAFSIRISDRFLPLSLQKDLKFTIDIDPELPEKIMTDGLCVEQVVKNLLANAFKFTKRGHIAVKIRWSRFRGETSRVPSRFVDFAVMDTGIGIPVEKQDIIFEAFQQADGTTSRQYGGTGLGLSISSAIAHLLGGSIHVDSAVGLGSSFTFSIPGNPA